MKNLRILIVEDETIVAMELEVLLTQLGYNVVSIVDTGQAAIDQVETERPDLILMDIRIKGNMDGVQTANEILACHNIPIVFSTAEIDERKIDRIDREMPFSYVLKPIRKRDLQIAIEMAFHVTKIDQERRSAEEALQAAHDNLEKLVEERTAELSKSNEFLIEAKIKAEEANAAKSMFLANISHELRTPMHHILNYSKFGEEKSDSADREKLNHYFSQIRKTGNRLLSLLNDLLDLSKLESGHTTYKKQETDLIVLIDTVLDEFSQTASQKLITFQKSVKAVDPLLFCDDFRVSQVLRNIVSNAMKYSPKGGTIYVAVSEAKIRDGFRRTDIKNTKGFEIRIRDQGVGIPEDELLQIFDKFTQSSRTRTKTGGTGLGLSICKEIVLAHRGEIWAENHPEGGSVFCFTLPKFELA